MNKRMRQQAKSEWESSAQEAKIEMAKLALIETHGNVTKAAEQLGISRAWFSSFLQRHGAAVGITRAVICEKCGHSNPLRRRAGVSVRTPASASA